MKARQIALISTTAVMATLFLTGMFDLDIHPIRCGVTSFISSTYLVLFMIANA